jgi:hypothetical protein
MAGVPRLKVIALDAPDPQTLAAFYSAITGWKVESEDTDCSYEMSPDQPWQFSWLPIIGRRCGRVPIIPSMVFAGRTRLQGSVLHAESRGEGG